MKDKKLEDSVNDFLFHQEYGFNRELVDGDKDFPIPEMVKVNVKTLKDWIQIWIKGEY